MTELFPKITDEALDALRRRLDVRIENTLEPWCHEATRDAILKHSDVREAAAIGVPDALRGQVVKAFVVADRSGDEAFTREIQDLVRQRLSQHEYPRLVEFVAELPKTPAGKVNRKILRTRENAHVG